MATRSPLVVNETTGNTSPIPPTDTLGPFAGGASTGEAMVYDQFGANSSEMTPLGDPEFASVLAVGLVATASITTPLIQHSTHIDITPASGHMLDINVAGAGGALRVLSTGADAIQFDRSSDTDTGTTTNYRTASSSKWSVGPANGSENLRWFSSGAGGNALVLDYTTGYATLLGLTVTNDLTVNGNTTIGNASGDTLTISPNAVTWSNNPTHSGDHTFSGSVSVNGNTAIGNASGDTLTINAAAWAVPNAVTWTKTAETGVAEELARWQLSDSTSYFRLVNGTSNASQFAPTFESFIEAGVASTALSFSGTKGVSTTPGNPAILFIGRYNSGSGNTDIPDAGIMVEFRNRATSKVYVYGNGDLVLVGAGAKVGYGTGAGGTVTQATSKTTGVTLNRPSGEITMNNAALAAGTIVSFVFTNSVIAATDLMILNHVSGGTPGSYLLNARCGSGSATIDVRNETGGSLSEAIVLRFAIIKGASS